MDVVSKEKRSEMMAGIQGKNTAPETAIRKELFRRKYRFRIHDKSLPGKPDLVLAQYKAVIFIEGCFWHCHECSIFRWPKSRQAFWKEKLTGNKRRDEEVVRILRKSGWRVLRIWECSLKGPNRFTLREVVDLTEWWLKSGQLLFEISGKDIFNSQYGIGTIELKKVVILGDGTLVKDKFDTYGTDTARQLAYDTVYRMFSDLGIQNLYVKALASNDNSKNQIYLGGDFKSLNLIPVHDFEVFSPSSQKATLGEGKKLIQGKLNFKWLDPAGQTAEASDAKLILYPQYPEVRFSGFLKGSRVNLGKWMDVNKNGRDVGRFLIFGVHDDGTVFGYLAVPDSRLANDLNNAGFSDSDEILQELGPPDSLQETSESRLIRQLTRVYEISPILGQKLNARTLKTEPYTARNGGGYTLEAELGVSPNGYAAPDYQGWEVKAHGMSVVTLMTPEPSGGLYKTEGLQYFMKEYGYPDVSGRKDRINFGGIHKCNIETPRTGLTMKAVGFDAKKGKFDPAGSISLIDRKENIAAEWSYKKLLEHWNRKHAQTVYVDYTRTENRGLYSYSFGPIIHLGKGTDFSKFLSAFENQTVYLDPGIKIEEASSLKPKVKKRNQFRTNFSQVSSLYEEWNVIDLSAPEKNKRG